MSYQSADGFFGDLFSPVLSAASDGICQAKAEAAQKPLDDARDEAARSWPTATHIFRTVDVLALYDQTFAILVAASHAIDKQAAENVSDKQMLRAQQSVIQKLIGVGTEKYLIPSQKAQAARIEQIDAVDLRKWVLSCMSESATGYFAVALSACNQPWFVKALGAVVAAANAVVEFIKKIVRFVYNTGKAILSIPGDIADMVAKAVLIAEVSAVAYVGYYLYKHYYKKAPAK